MKYILLSDLEYLNRNKYKCIFFILMISIYPFFIRLALNYNFSNLESMTIFLSNIGISNNINSFIEFGLLLLNIGFVCYITIDIYNLNRELGNENIFLRISYKKWLLYKIISIMIINFCILITELGVLILIYDVLNFSFEYNLFNLMINTLSVKLILAFLILLLFNINNKIYYIFINGLYLLFCIYKNKLASVILYYSGSYISIIFLILIIIIFYLVACNNLYNQIKGGTYD